MCHRQINIAMFSDHKNLPFFCQKEELLLFREMLEDILPVWFTVMLPSIQLLLWHRRLLIEEAPLEDAAEMLLSLVYRSVVKVVPVNTIDRWHRHDRSVTQNNCPQYRSPIIKLMSQVSGHLSELVFCGELIMLQNESLTLLTREPDQSGSRSRLHCNRQMAPQI